MVCRKNQFDRVHQIRYKHSHGWFASRSGAARLLLLDIVNISVAPGSPGLMSRSNGETERYSMDRSEINRALAKAIAYKQCGKDREAEDWARRLVELLECAEILK